MSRTHLDGSDIFIFLQNLKCCFNSSTPYQPIFIETNNPSLEKQIPHIIHENHLWVDCNSLLDNSLLFCLISCKLWKLSKKEASKICSLKLFFEFLQERSIPIHDDPLTVILWDAQEILREDPKFLWTLSHLEVLFPHFDGPFFRLVICSSDPATEFRNIIGDIYPIILKDDSRYNENHVDFVVENYRPFDIPEKQFRILVQNVYSLVKDQIKSSRELFAHVKRVLPHLRELSATKNIPITETGKLFHMSLKFMNGIVNGDHLRSLTITQINALNDIEKYLLVASYIASNNPAKFDLRLFGSLGKRARVSKKFKSQNSKSQDKKLRTPPKSFFVERILAIFYFITAEPVPKLAPVIGSIVGLAKRGLLQRSALSNRLDHIKYRCNLSIDFVSTIAKELKFDLNRYLSINY